MKKIIVAICFCSIVFNNYTNISANNYNIAYLYTPNGSVFVARIYESEDNISMLEYYMERYFEPYANNPNVTLLSCASDRYNCHGFAWGISEGGPVCGIEPFIEASTPHFHEYWLDGSYEETTEEYAEKSYNQGHSTVISSYPGMHVSKWSSGPLVRHPFDMSPYSDASTYYRLKCPAKIKNRTYTSNNINIHSRCEVEISNTTVEDSASMVIKSNTQIRLLSGFHAKAGSSFHAKIELLDFDVDNPVISIPILSEPCEGYMNTSSAPSLTKQHDIINTSNENEEITSEEEISTLNNTTEIEIYPNPANDKITVKSNAGEYIKQITITDSFGLTVISTNTKNSSSADINISGLINGIYSVRVISENNTVRTAIFIKK